jgi:hypothetical protein
MHAQGDHACFDCCLFATCVAMLAQKIKLLAHDNKPDWALSAKSACGVRPVGIPARANCPAAFSSV